MCWKIISQLPKKGSQRHDTAEAGFVDFSGGYAAVSGQGRADSGSEELAPFLAGIETQVQREISSIIFSALMYKLVGTRDGRSENLFTLFQVSVTVALTVGAR